MNRQVSPDRNPGHLLLGGWHDVMDDLLRLQRSVTAADGQCRCGQAAGIDAACPCCERGTRDVASVCDACTREIAAVGERIERIEEDTLRFLPAVLELFDTTPERHDEAIAVQRRLAQLLLTFRHLRSATHEWAQGCRTTHLPAVKALAEDGAVPCRRFDATLRRHR